MLGVMFYQGKSLFDGKPIIGIASFRSKNTKTGNMVQSLIMREDVNPFTAWCNGQDVSVCGNCKHRLWRTCYVNKAFAPYQTFLAYKRNRYPLLNNTNIKQFNGRTLRIGSYGDPTAIPLECWLPIIKSCKSFSGYTHQFATCDQRWKKYLMASVDTISEYNRAKALGWRTFRIRTPITNRLPDEFICPASSEGGKKTTCNKCCSCNGLAKEIKKDVCIIAHGRKGIAKRLVKMLTLKQNKKKFSHLIPARNMVSGFPKAKR